MVEITKICPGAVSAVVISTTVKQQVQSITLDTRLCSNPAVFLGIFRWTTKSNVPQDCQIFLGGILILGRVKFKNGSTRTSGVPLLEYCRSLLPCVNK